MKYLLDTNICIHLLKKKEKSLIRKITYFSASDFSICSIVKAELLTGAKKSQNVSENIKMLSSFFGMIESLPFDDFAAEFYSTTRSILEKSGEPIGPNDLFIASIALSNELTLITRNYNEFKKVPGLLLENW